ncbi:MAG: YkgJ family cysteine cluster protein [Clostridia bacterium]|nr:YkgJ family cysteine cluster protein [Clostridia bacterium]NCC44704.1 YkgJ family cysteine cluster protein [Clostridia bacterium]
MQITVPHYYKRFHCVAGECEDTCCAGWKIMIDDKSLERYRGYPGDFGNRLRNSVDMKESSFKQYDSRCAFLSDEGLCDIYSEAGPQMLCATCRNYPRHIEEFEGLREISLSLSCIEAAKIVLGCEEKVRFLTKEKAGEEEFADFDFFLYTNLTLVRDEMIEILQNRENDIRERISRVTALAHDFQNRIDGQKLYQTEELLARCRRGKMKPVEISATERFHTMKRIFGIFDQMEVLKKDFPELIKEARQALYADGAEAYYTNYVEFEKAVGSESEKKEAWERYGEQLMIYFIFTYFCGAVYDENAYAKAKLAVVSTLLIQELCMAVWIRKEGKIGFDDLVNIAHRYSREIEHSDDNLNQMEKILDESKEFHLGSLLKLLSD